MDRYNGYKALKKEAFEERDYKILFRKGRSRYAIVAPHGGGIEPGTADIADALAGRRHTYYAFKGIRKSGNKLLHITSARFDEPRGLAVAAAAEIVVTVHGHHGIVPRVYIGGRHRTLKQCMLTALRQDGFDAVISTRPGLRGNDPNNICNRCRSGRGVQLEISRGLRDLLFEHLEHRGRRNRTIRFHRFIAAIDKELA